MLEPIFEALAPIGLSESNFQFMCIAAILGVSIYITLYGGMFSLANAGFMAIGAYVSVVLTQQEGWDFFPAVVAGALAAGLIAIPLGLLVLHLNDIYLAIATIGFGEIARVSIRNFDRVVFELTDERVRITNGAQGISRIPVLTETEHLIIVILLLAFFLYRMHDSRFGRALAAMRRDRIVAASMGINVVYYRNLAFIIGALIAGLAGALSGHLTRVITPETYDFSQAVDILAYAVFGGTYTLIGPIVGGMTLEYIPEVLRRLDVFQAMTDATGVNFIDNEAQIIGFLNGLVLVLVIIYLPGGITDPQLWRNLRARLVRWVGRG
ncbi:MAG: branched-chain amino acid ABC transporter permease [Anaerolineales bacterium]